MASKILVGVADPLVITIFRFLIALFALGVIGFWKKMNFQFGLFLDRTTEVVLLGVVGYVGLYYFQMTGLKSISSSQSASIMLLAPIVTLILNTFLSKKIRLVDILVISTCFLGAYLILLDSQEVSYRGAGFNGIILTLLASLCLGISVIQTKRLLRPTSCGLESFSVFNVTFYSLLIGLIGLSIIAVIESRFVGSSLDIKFESFAWLLYLGLICSVVAFLLWNWSIKHTHPTIVAGSMYLKTPVALGLGAFVLSEKLGLIFYLGSFAILVSLLFEQFLLSRTK